MSQSPHQVKAKSLTAKFKKEREEMLRLNSPYDPWIVLQSPKTPRKSSNGSPSFRGSFFALSLRDRSDSLSTDATDGETISSTSAEETSGNDHVLVSELKELVETTSSDGLSGGFYKLHDLCAAQNPRIEMIRMLVCKPSTQSLAFSYVLSLVCCIVVSYLRTLGC
jgi:hypothetical protein